MKQITYKTAAFSLWIINELTSNAEGKMTTDTVNDILQVIYLWYFCIFEL